MLLYCFYYILLKTIPYRSDPFQMDIAYWITTKRFTEPSRTEPLNKTGLDICKKKKNHNKEYLSLICQALRRNNL